MSETGTPANEREPALSPVLILLFKGVLYRDEQPAAWQDLLRLQAQVRDHTGVFGLELILDEAEGYAYLRQRPAEEGEEELPRLVPRRQLSYPVSLLLALLRKKLAEHDATGGDPRLILSSEQITDMVRLFLPETGDEVRLMNRMDGHIKRVVELGFLRRLRGQEERFEVRRILAAFVDAQWLAEFDQRLADYRQHLDDKDDG
ncbi:DUF4194 domain-containing protein [Halomonas sp. FeN2]|uniref:DUF4194 domain-containing protein n=1 Tax=Halomonadaceae TaxID=28256 RepID=UPI000C4280A8|nr:MULTISPECIES: DUF4194 domain-containing protein [unclassified Halomonas]MBF56885.1 hypothetical protein [Halomonas sp.]UBR48912.1 DUF4194 domain-containing protein [Halomonas sp. FeN2]|tara:strand:+ start:1753 stop:2361 length:609 start_codon:yes stop_codon:yes gene_type:complete